MNRLNGDKNNRGFNGSAWLLMTLLTLFGLQACQDGVSNDPQQETTVTSSTYSGPAARTSDIQGFRVSVWEPLRAQNRCGACHNAGGQAPLFVREDDVNQAYEAVNPFINRSEPDESSLVTKVANGHNCWEASDSACATIIANYIESWVGGGANAGRQIELEAPPENVVGESKVFPDDSSLFASHVHPLLTDYCTECHVEDAAAPQSPYFAAADVETAYAAVKTSIDLDTPSNSRLVQRLIELHNCWDDCPSNAQEMETAIDNMASGISPTPVDPDLVVSRALTLPEGTVASGGSRQESDVIALYEFKTGSGNTAYDTSGVDPAINLTLSGDTTWVEGWGLEFRTGKAQGSTSDSRKLSQLIQATGEYTVEAWVVPSNVTQEGPARIISYSAGTDDRNFTLGQTLYNYNFLHRSSTTDGNGEPAHSTSDDDEDLQATEQHVVVTFDPENGRQVYVNGIHTDDLDETAAGNLNDWDDTYALVLGNEASGDRPWAGKVRLLAIHNRALNGAQIQQNFEAGVGEKYFLLFNVSSLLNLPQSYVMIEVSQFDNYSYLFRQPKFISLDESVLPGSIPIQGMRIGINGKEAAIGQAYATLDTTINDSEYTVNGQLLSNIGTTIATEKGSENDQFFLTFERLGEHTNVFIEPEALPPTEPADGEPVSKVGLRTFDEINATMASLTGVSQTLEAVQTTYTTIKQQLPSAEAINGFLSSHQVAVSQLAIEYCSAMVDDTTLRAGFFPGFDFNANANDIATATWQSQVVNPLIVNFMGENLTTQPDPGLVESELMRLLTGSVGLARCSGQCAADRTEKATKAACASLLGSAVVLLQ
ncbi:MAG: LamG domain-containing protein [Candidatus Thiodiazotropha taylori]|nr:LamG domain-containing protein [Candidatus Thiodiazotropha taylori]MCG7908517.1 LamG domain-containing protein [Candidatus Thiodiazotropha taylori]